MTTSSRPAEQDQPTPATPPISPAYGAAGQAEAPDVSALSGIPIQCQFCVGRTFRRSRLRSSDLPQLFLMRYPVRCRRCSQRQMVSFTVAGISVPSHVRHKQRHGSSQSTASDQPISPQ